MKFAILLLSLLSGGIFAFEPYAELTSSATNLIVTESADVYLNIYLPSPDEKEFGDEAPPYHPQLPLHVHAPFLEAEWKSDSITIGNLNEIPVLKRSRNIGFTLNKYASSGIDSFFGSDDPFSLFDRDPFEMMGPKRVVFKYSEIKTVEVDGEKVWKLTVKAPKIKGVSEGEVKLGAINVSVSLLDKVVKDRRGRGKIGLKKEKIIRVKPLEIKVSNPPLENRPENYCGAIGSNITVRATLDSSVYTTGDPAMFTIEISGMENPADVGALSFREFETNTYFRIDKSSLKTDTQGNTRIFKWRVRLIKAGTVEFPSLGVSVFNLDGRTYNTLKTPPIPIQVKAGAQIVLGNIEEDGEVPFPFPDGIDLNEKGIESVPMLPRLPVSILLFVIPPVLFVLVKLLPVLFSHFSESARLSREKNAFEVCKKELEKVKSVTSKEKAVRKFFLLKYKVNPDVVTAFDVRRLMGDEFSSEDIRLVEKALEDIEKMRYSSRYGGVRVVFLFLFSIFSFVVFSSTAAISSQRVKFAWHRANSMAINAMDEAGFKKAADAYGECIREGAKNPIVFSNYGACLLLSKNAREAYDMFMRVECYAGETPSTIRGLRSAKAVMTNDPRSELSLCRVFLKPHFKYSLDDRLFCLAVSWALLWGVLLLPKGFFKRWLAGILIVFIVLSAVSVSTSLLEEVFSERSVKSVE